MSSHFTRLQARATAQGCVLEREPRGFSLYSNRTFTGMTGTLADVMDCLAFDESFGALPMPPLSPETVAAISLNPTL